MTLRGELQVKLVKVLAVILMITISLVLQLTAINRLTLVRGSALESLKRLT